MSADRIIGCLVRGAQAGLIYALAMLLYTHLVTANVTRLHDLDFGVFQNLIPFALIGLGFGGLLGVADAYLNAHARRVPPWVLAGAIWGVFALPTLLLTLTQPERYEFALWQHAQGLAFAVFLGLAYSGLGRLNTREMTS